MFRSRQHGSVQLIDNHKTLLPIHPLEELLQALHVTAHEQPGISGMLQENSQKYYNPSIEKPSKVGVKGFEICQKDKRVPNNAIPPEIPNLPEGDISSEDAMQIDLLTNLSSSGGYQKKRTLQRRYE